MRVLLVSFLVNLLDLNSQAGILLFNSIANRVIFEFILLVFMPHDVVSVLNGALYLLLSSLCEIELHYCIIFELRFANYVQLSLCFRKNSESCKIFISRFETFEIFDDELRVLSKLNEKVLVCLDSLEFPIVAFEQKIKVYLCIASQLYLDRFGELMLVLDHYLHSQLLRLLECLYSLRFFLYFDDKAMLAAVDYLTALANCRIDNSSGRFDTHHLYHGPVRALIHYI